MTWKRALVTGASSGIGRAIAEQLAAAGSNLVLVARSEDVLEELAASLRQTTGAEVEVLPADLTDPGELAKVEARVRDLALPVDLVVNNAGFGTFGAFHELDIDREESMIALNVTALVRLSHAAASVMAARGEGGILNVSSLAGNQPLPFNATYGATKAFVTSFGEAVHEELRGTGVHVTTLCPGFTRTGFQETADVQENWIPDMVWMEAGPVAAAGLKAVADNKAVAVPGLGNRATSALSALLPNAVIRRVVGKTLKRL